MKNYPISILRKIVAFTLIFLLLLQTVGCRYFKINSLASSKTVTIENIGQIHKKFILHAGDKIYSLKDIEASTTSISGEVADMDSYVFYYKNRKTKYAKEEKGILNEVHIYLIDDIVSLDYGRQEIPMASISEMRIIEHDSGKTTGSYIFGTIGGVAGVFLVLLIIAAATKSSCPYIYVNDGEGFVFEGEIFGGAISKNLQRNDYMPLPNINPDKGEYQIRITNELKERQYTDLAELIVVNHPKDSKVLLDKNGNTQLIQNAQPVIQAQTENGLDLSKTLAVKDKSVHFFNDEEQNKNNIQLKFEKPSDAKTAKLVLNAKNTLWFDYLFGEFLSKFGMTYEDWVEKQNQKSTEERMDVIRQSDIPLSIYIKQNNSWQFVDYLHTIGPLANRDFVVPIDITNLEEDVIEIKLETGFMFWEIDYVAMDFSENILLERQTVKPAKALGTGSQDWTENLMRTDGNYMAQLNIGDLAEVNYFVKPPPADQIQSVFLHTSGYYELIRNFKGMPHVTELNKFKIPGHFSEFSKVRYLQMLNKEAS